MKRETRNTKHRTQNTEHETQNTEHRTRNTEHRTRNVERIFVLGLFSVPLRKIALRQVKIKSL